MDDQNNTNNQNPINTIDQSQTGQNPQPIQDTSTVNTLDNSSPVQQPPVNQDQNAEIPGFAQMDSSTPPPPPIPTVEEIPDEPQGTNAPNMDIPPVITSDDKPKKKFGGKAIATILGVLLLVGGIGTGVILLNQQQEIRTKAGGSCSLDSNNEYGIGGCTSPYICTNTGAAPTGYECIMPGGSNSDCSTTGCLSGYKCGTDKKCQPIGRCINNDDCNSGFECVNWDCVASSCPAGTIKEHIGDYGYCGWPVCGPGDETICMNGCTCPQGCTCTGPEYPDTHGSTFASKICQCGGGGTPSSPNPSSPNPSSPNPPSSPSPVVSCLNIKAYDTTWKALTLDELKELNAGDTVRFTVSGTATSGTFSKAKFTINTVVKPETTTKKPNTNEFYIEYIIPENVTNFSINAQLYHSTKGWI